MCRDPQTVLSNLLQTQATHVVAAVAGFGVVARAEVERGRASAQFGGLEFLLEEVDPEADYVHRVVVAEKCGK